MKAPDNLQGPQKTYIFFSQLDGDDVGALLKKISEHPAAQGLDANDALYRASEGMHDILGCLSISQSSPQAPFDNIKLYFRPPRRRDVTGLDWRRFVLRVLRKVEEIQPGSSAGLHAEIDRREKISPLSLLSLRVSGSQIEVETYHDAPTGAFLGPQVSTILNGIIGARAREAGDMQMNRATKAGLYCTHLSVDLLPRVADPEFTLAFEPDPEANKTNWISLCPDLNGRTPPALIAAKATASQEQVDRIAEWPLRVSDRTI